MQWTELRAQYPDEWVVVEALQAHTERDRRIVEQLAVVERLPDSVAAWQRYQALHAAAPERELYVIHTSREELEIIERRWLGIRAAS
jgi:hypothetical protein